MSFARLGPLVLIVAFGCRFPNPAFDDGDVGDTDEFGDGSNGESAGSLGESAEGEGESADGESNSQTSNDGVDTIDSNDGVDSSSSGSTSDESTGDEMDGSSEGVDSSSSGSSSDGFDTSSDGVDTSSDDLMSSSSDGLDAPDLSCPQVFPADDCYSCMNNNCCTDLDVSCFDGVDEKCHCTLQCLAEGGDNCAVQCGADPLKEEHANMIFECGQLECANLCV